MLINSMVWQRLSMDWVKYGFDISEKLQLRYLRDFPRSANLLFFFLFSVLFWEHKRNRKKEKTTAI